MLRQQGGWHPLEVGKYYLRIDIGGFFEIFLAKLSVKIADV